MNNCEENIEHYPTLAVHGMAWPSSNILDSNTTRAVQVERAEAHVE